MGNLIGILFGTVIVGTLVFAMNLFFVGVAGVLRLLPLALPLVGRGMWALLVFSCRLYYLLLTRLAPLFERYTRIKLLDGLWRLGTTLTMSVVFGLVFLLISHVPINFWSVIPFVIHGLFVDFAWDEIPGLGELQMGVRT